jgi:hypothetical protein
MRHSILSLTMRLTRLGSCSRMVPLSNSRKVPLKFSSGYLRSTEATSQRLLEAFLRFLTERNLSGRMTIRPHKSITN